MRSILFYFILFAFLFSSCKKVEGDFPGREYVPDMVHSISYQPNLYNYYWLNTWGGEAEYYGFVLPKNPVEGTLPIGQAGLYKAIDESEAAEIRNKLQGFSLSGSVPYYYEDTEEDRQRAMDEIIDNPFPITAAGLAKGKKLYDIYCGICHGTKGDGNGFLVREDGGVYPAQPTSFLLEEFIEASNGRFYHSIMRGRNVMGAYNDKLSFEERWQVIHYIRSLQAEEMGVVYNENENTLNDIDVPGSIWLQ
jgi:mono/diheme cytochrome c family protein